MGPGRVGLVVAVALVAAGCGGGGKEGKAAPAAGKVVRGETETGMKLYRLKQAYTPDRWGFLDARSPYTPRFIQIAVKVYF